MARKLRTKKQVKQARYNRARNNQDKLTKQSAEGWRLKRQLSGYKDKSKSEGAKERRKQLRTIAHTKNNKVVKINIKARHICDSKYIGVLNNREYIVVNNKRVYLTPKKKKKLDLSDDKIFVDKINPYFESGEYLMNDWIDDMVDLSIRERETPSYNYVKFVVDKYYPGANVFDILEDVNKEYKQARLKERSQKKYVGQALQPSSGNTPIIPQTSFGFAPQSSSGNTPILQPKVRSKTTILQPKVRSKTTILQPKVKPKPKTKQRTKKTKQQRTKKTKQQRTKITPAQRKANNKARWMKKAQGKYRPAFESLGLVS